MLNNINEISFATSVKSLTLQTYVDSLNRYRNGIDQAINLKSDLPIFIDTNVFLRYYSIAEVDREPLLEFFSQYKERIYITTQVQKEIVKNREDVIERFFEDTLGKLKNSFRNDIVNKVGSYREEFKKVINDFTFLGNFLNGLSDELEKTYVTISEQVANKKSNLNSAKYDDGLLKLMSEMNLINNLSEEDIKILKTEFDSLKKGIESKNVSTEIKKPQKAFPGLGDIKEKPENPYGDYIIFHELIKHVREADTDAIFLTYDSSKGDWFRKNKQPHDHYIQATYISTSNVIFFFEAERFFTNKLNKKFDLIFSPIENISSSKDEYVKDFILKYIEFERSVRKVGERASVDKSNKAPLSRIIVELLKMGHVNDDFLSQFRSLNEFKNILVHHQDRNVIDSYNESIFIDSLIELNELKNLMESLYDSL